MNSVYDRPPTPTTQRTVSALHRSRLGPSAVWRYRLWKPSHASVVLQQFGATRKRLDTSSDEEHLRIAAAWLARAQDASNDGGVVGRYNFRDGWTSSYPETTGYIVPTFIGLADHLGDPSFEERAKRCVDFLLSVQLDDGAFPGGEVADNRDAPSPFNTAQVINGLLAWHQRSGDEASLAAARRAGDWLVSSQDPDGAWRKWFFRDTPAVYSAHLSCWLADLGAHCEDERFLRSASKHTDWVLEQHERATGWFDCASFYADEQDARAADLHAISYTLAGLLRLGTVLGRKDAVTAVFQAADALRCVQSDLGCLPAVLDWQWRPRVDSECLTGYAQIALTWMSLYELSADPSWRAAAMTAIEHAKRGQILHSVNEDLRGGIPGAFPLWGYYCHGTLPNWPVKFFIDALLRKRKLNLSDAVAANAPQ